MDYRTMEGCTQTNVEDTYEKYIKAYYFFKLGKFNESYRIYTEISQLSFEKEDYLMYYFSQVNRYVSYRALESLGNYAQSPAGVLTGYMAHDKSIDEEIKMYMKHFDVDEIFNSLPLAFQSDYASLKDLYNDRYLFKNIYNVTIATEKVEDVIKAKSTELGYSSLGKVRGILDSQLNFVFGNYLIVDECSEFKYFVKKSIKAILLKYSDGSNEYLAENELQKINGRNEVQLLNPIDFTCMIQYFASKELKSIFNEYGIKELKFKNLDVCIEVVKNILKYYNPDLFKIRYLHQKFEQYLNNSIEILKYVMLTKEDYDYVVREMFKINNYTLNIGTKILFLDKQQYKNSNIHGEIFPILEDVFLEYLNKKIEAIENKNEFNEDSTNGLFHIDIARYISANKENYISDRISEKVLEILQSKIEFGINEIIKITPILSANVVDNIISLANAKLAEEFDFSVFKLMVEYGLIDKIDIYEGALVTSIIDNKKKLENLQIENSKVQYTKKQFDEMSIDTNMIIKIDNLEKYVLSILEGISYWCYVGMLNKNKFIQFKGTCNQFDFFIDMDNFDFNNFEDRWLLDFNVIDAHKEIAKNKTAKAFVKKIIEEYLINPKFDAKQKNWFIKLYLEIYNRD